MRRRLLSAMTTALFVWLAEAAFCPAAVLTYSWSGQFVPNVAGEDPWSLGAAGQPFELRASVQENAADTLHLNTEFAGFAVESVHLAINGVEIEYLGGGTLDFTDNHEGQYDLVAFDGSFQVLGQALDIGAAVSLPTSTFAFSSLVETPPQFVATTNAVQTTYSPPGPYSGVVESGVSVTAVPEPRFEVLLSGCAVVVGALRRRMCLH